MASDLPRFPKELSHLGFTPQTVLSPEDEDFLQKLILQIRAGKKTILVVEEADHTIKWMTISATRAQSVSILGKVLEATGQRLQGGET